MDSEKHYNYSYLCGFESRYSDWYMEPVEQDTPASPKPFIDFGCGFIGQDAGRIQSCLSIIVIPALHERGQLSARECHYSNTSLAYVDPHQSTTTTADKLVDEVFSWFGVPEELHSDQGGNFEAKVFQKLEASENKHNSEYVVEDRECAVFGQEEEETFEFDSDDDEEHIPLCVRPVDAIQQKLCLDALQAISMEDTVHDILDTESMESQPAPEVIKVQCEDDIVEHLAAITYHTCLKQLAEYLLLPIPVCTEKDPLTLVECQAPGPFQILIKSRGTGVIMTWICRNNHCVWQWNSQPSFKYGMQAGDFLLASNIILSGNNYNKIALLFKFMNMRVVDRCTFFKIQDTYCVDIIKKFWDQKRAEVVSRLQSKDNVVVLADGRMDSPGFCAQYCTYTVMENDTKEILSIVNIDKRETQRSSVIMEKEGFIRSFDQLKQEVKLAEVCTDAHTQISALFNPVKGKYKESGVLHTLDMWHGSKNLGKKIQAAGQQRGCSILLQWNKDICNHFWFCCKTAENYDEFFDMWIG
ncbi:uncharacterized protein LOC106532736, partial [Austrofundulus limnaeus]|uniref:Uncharacterized protein LOC106532736 n=1 Tax=Austrofundulus limnaeus TaxID=52670 RepID=A0A2I4CWD1_AUSLI